MKTKIGAVAGALLIGTAFLAGPAAPAHAATITNSSASSTTPTTVVAADPAGVVIAQDQSATLTAEPSAPRAVTVTTEPGATVTLTAKGTKARTVRANKDGKATFTKLTAGKNYTVTSNGKQTQVTPVVNVGKAADLTVTTTDRVDTVDLTWQHKATKARGGSSVGYTITATPAQGMNTQGMNSNDALAPITMEATGTTAELTGLDPTALYSFSVTPHNALGDGTPSVARMNRSLADITGLSVPTKNQPANTNPTPKQPAPASQPQPAPAPAPAPAPKPATRTIWVCPDGYDDVNGVCTQTQDYTFTDVTETKPYTYHNEFVVTGWRVDPYPCSSGTMHPDGCWVAQGYDQQVKDATPAGWTDNGSSWERTVQQKDATPSGWSDNGSAWIRTTAKVEKVVPA